MNQLVDGRVRRRGGMESGCRLAGSGRLQPRRRETRVARAWSISMSKAECMLRMCCACLSMHALMKRSGSFQCRWTLSRSVHNAHRVHRVDLILSQGGKFVPSPRSPIIHAGSCALIGDAQVRGGYEYASADLPTSRSHTPRLLVVRGIIEHVEARRKIPVGSRDG